MAAADVTLIYSNHVTALVNVDVAVVDWIKNADTAARLLISPAWLGYLVSADSA
jgi:hypothetical protein